VFESRGYQKMKPLYWECTSSILLAQLMEVVVVDLKLFYQYLQGGSNMTGTNCDLFTHK
jgi:hypothetical protein